MESQTWGKMSKTKKYASVLFTTVTTQFVDEITTKRFTNNRNYNSATSCCSWPFLNSLSVSSPPPILFPPMNTLGTVDRPVRSFKAL